MTILVTGASGFIGYHLCMKLLAAGHKVCGLDAMTAYYDPVLKTARLKQLQRHSAFSFHRQKIEDMGAVAQVFQDCNPKAVVHLAGQVGVRYSLEHPEEYVSSNIVGSFNVLECAKNAKVDHLLMASTSSAYGANTKFPAQESHKADLPLTIYAASKRSSELMAHSYAHLYDLPVSLLRFFTVYGPWGRPDMAPMLFMDAMVNQRAINVYNHGKMSRDFTYVKDLVENLEALIDKPPVKGQPVDHFDTLSPVAPHRVINIGNANPVQLMDFIKALESASGISANINYCEMQPGDMLDTSADTSLLKALTALQPDTSIHDGVQKFVSWYKSFYQV